MRLGERFSYCDPQIPVQAGVRLHVSGPESAGVFRDLSVERGRLGKSPAKIGTVACGLGKDSVTVIPRFPPRRGFGRASVSRCRRSNSPAGFTR